MILLASISVKADDDFNDGTQLDDSIKRIYDSSVKRIICGYPNSLSQVITSNTDCPPEIVISDTHFKRCKNKFIF